MKNQLYINFLTELALRLSEAEAVSFSP